MNIQPAQTGNPQITAKKRSRKPENWKQEKIKTAKVKGQQHVNHVQQDVPQRMREDLLCHCPVPCRDMFTDAQKDQIFEDYYKLGVRMDQQGRLFYKTTTYGTQELTFTLVKNAYTVQDLQNCLQNVPDAYQSYIKIKETKLVNVKKLLRFVQIPEEKIFYDILDLEGNVETESSDDDE